MGWTQNTSFLEQIFGNLSQAVGLMGNGCRTGAATRAIDTIVVVTTAAATIVAAVAEVNT